jgi:hypothetical protein
MPVRRARRWAMFALVCVVILTSGLGPVHGYGLPWFGCRDEDPETRAGNPRSVAPWAHPSDTGRYCPYRVGGGAAYHGEAPGPEEGTWGWDYPGILFPARIALGWWHGRKYQGGTGSYKVDGYRKPEHEGASFEKHGEGHE